MTLVSAHPGPQALDVSDQTPVPALGFRDQPQSKGHCPLPCEGLLGKTPLGVPPAAFNFREFGYRYPPPPCCEASLEIDPPNVPPVREGASVSNHSTDGRRGTLVTFSMSHGGGSSRT